MSAYVHASAYLGKVFFILLFVQRALVSLAVATRDISAPAVMIQTRNALSRGTPMRHLILLRFWAADVFEAFALRMIICCWRGSCDVLKLQVSEQLRGCSMCTVPWLLGWHPFLIPDSFHKYLNEAERLDGNVMTYMLLLFICIYTRIARAQSAFIVLVLFMPSAVGKSWRFNGRT